MQNIKLLFVYIFLYSF